MKRRSFFGAIAATVGAALGWSAAPVAPKLFGIEPSIETGLYLRGLRVIGSAYVPQGVAWFTKDAIYVSEAKLSPPFSSALGNGVRKV